MCKGITGHLGACNCVLISDYLKTHFILLLAEVTYYQFHCLLEILNLQTLNFSLVIFLLLIACFVYSQELHIQCLECD